MWTKYRKEHVVKMNTVLEWSLIISVLGYRLFETWIARATPEELSNQCRSKKIVDGTETKETELNMLQRQWNKGAKG